MNEVGSPAGLVGVPRLRLGPGAGPAERHRPAPRMPAPVAHVGGRGQRGCFQADQALCSGSWDRETSCGDGVGSLGASHLCLRSRVTISAGLGKPPATDSS